MRRMALGTVLAWVVLSCGGGGNSDLPTIADICECNPASPFDYRYQAKHVPLPDAAPQEITVADILAWEQPSPPANEAPRSGRELQMFHIARAYLREAQLFTGDCDISMEISQTPDPSAPRVVVETPLGSSYCSARRSLQAQLAATGFVLSTQPKELSPPLPVEVLGLAFQDFGHDRGSAFIATTWEIHPAIVTVLE